ncbi:MAG TPA: hypothetical protein DCS83_02710 [Prevotella sp.]|nr:hypothetical protein [Prevotella sp.]
MDAVAEQDISRVDGVERDPNLTRRLLRSYARHQGQQVSASSIAADLHNNEGSSISDATVLSYISALKKIFIIEDMPAWNPNLRNGRYGLVEIKLGGDKLIKEGCENLKKLAR